MARENEQEFLMEVLQHNGPAVAFIQTLSRASQVLDDLVDKDRTVDEQQIVKTFWEILVELPANPFYRQNELYLRPLIAGVIQDWYDSVCLERSRHQHHCKIAFVLRDQMASLIAQCAYLVGGFDWSTQVGPSIRLFVYDESYEDYMSSLEAE